MNDDRLIAFLDELTALSHRYGLGIGPSGDLFELESDDAKRNYRCDDNSHIDFE